MASWKRSWQAPPVAQQLKLTQSSVTSDCSQWLPKKVAAQVHLYDQALSTNWSAHAPPFWQGADRQLEVPSGTLQSLPPKRGWHWHSKPKKESWQTPPFWQGLVPPSQSLISTCS